MSTQISAVNLFAQKKKYSQHRQNISRIMTKSSPVLKRKSLQDSLLITRHNNQLLTRKFKIKQHDAELQHRNQLIMRKILSCSNFKQSQPPNTKMRSLLNSSRMSAHNTTMKGLESQNVKFVKRLMSIKPTINISTQSSSYFLHKKRSMMISKYTNSPKPVPKNLKVIEPRVRSQLECMKSQNIKQISHKPIKFNSIKLERLQTKANQFFPPDNFMNQNQNSPINNIESLENLRQKKVDENFILKEKETKEEQLKKKTAEKKEQQKQQNKDEIIQKQHTNKTEKQQQKSQKEQKKSIKEEKKEIQQPNTVRKLQKNKPTQEIQNEQEYMEEQLQYIQ